MPSGTASICDARPRFLKGNMPRSWKPKGNKYGAKPTVVDGIRFDSKKEAKRYQDLRTLQKVGAVDFFLRQVPIDLPGNVKYRVDFVVFWETGEVTFEDVKGRRTDMYVMKKKQVEHLYPIEIKEL